MNRLALTGAFACLVSFAATAQPVYRCGSEYTHFACADARPLDVSDPVSVERRAEALATADRERRLGDSMARERRAEAAAFRPPMAANIGPRVPPAAAKARPTAAKKRRGKDKAKASDSVFDAETDFVARVPKTKKSAG
ncbi:MAG TPA: hypothetical protein VFF72_07770 [Caldimonas sp.]|nr:hypothetical protein [Caldimonas sp.]